MLFRDNTIKFAQEYTYIVQYAFNTIGSIPIAMFPFIQVVT